jgi:hypothetical protein
MRTSLPGYFLVVAVALLCSCSKVVYTHQQVLQGFHTKNDVTKRFGVPDEKKTGDSFEEWTYYRDTVGALNKPKKGDTLKSVEEYKGADSLKAGQYAIHDRYIKFIFDTAGIVEGYKSNGVNLSATKKDNFGKGVVRGLETTAAIVLLLGIVIAEDAYNNL